MPLVVFSMYKYGDLHFAQPWGHLCIIGIRLLIKALLDVQESHNISSCSVVLNLITGILYAIASYDCAVCVHIYCSKQTAKKT